MAGIRLSSASSASRDYGFWIDSSSGTRRFCASMEASASASMAEKLPARIRNRQPHWSVPLAITLAALTGLVLRLVYFSSPPYDGHAFRQTQTLYTIECFHAHGIDLLRPKTIYMGYPGIFVLELPLFQALAALLYNLLGPHLEIIRLVNILFGAGTAWLLYRSVKLLLDKRTAVLAALIYWLAPLNTLYQRSMLLDPMAVYCAMLSFYCFLRLIPLENRQMAPEDRTENWIYYILFAVGTWLAAMLKALYLWPSTLLLFWAVLTRRIKPDLRAARILVAFAVAGISFLLWNRYAQRVNDASPFTRGVQPTSLLGMSPLADPQYYYNMIIRRPKWWLGALGALLYPVGLWACWSERRDLVRASAMLLLVLIPPIYLVLFSFINRPHDYYQLIITPFLAVVPANALQWVAKRAERQKPKAHPRARWALPGLCVGFLVATPLTYLFWYHGGKPDALLLRFEQLCAGKIVPDTSGMVFICEDRCSCPPDSYIPEFLYAARLWGYARVVPNDASARAYFEKWSPEFPRLEYVVLYGTGRPGWLPAKDFQLASEDSTHGLYIFRRASHG